MTVFVGITATSKKIKNNFSQNQSVTLLANFYFDLFKHYPHVIPFILSPNIDPKSILLLCDKLDGIIFSSGEDIDPHFYNQKPMISYDENLKGLGNAYNRPSLLAPNAERDLFEISLYNHAKKNQLPIMGICRGMQIINVAEGGTLHQELPPTSHNHFIEEDGWIHYHDLIINQDSKFYEMMQLSQTIIPSIHHQAIDRLGRNLKISAYAPDNLIEVIESTYPKNFILGVQGHFEKHVQNFPVFKKILDDFVKAMRLKRG